MRVRGCELNGTHHEYLSFVMSFGVIEIKLIPLQEVVFLLSFVVSVCVCVCVGEH